MKHRPRASRSSLLQLPAGILADLVELLKDDRKTLASLALVDSDCQQLACCCQFPGAAADTPMPEPGFDLEMYYEMMIVGPEELTDALERQEITDEDMDFLIVEAAEDDQGSIEDYTWDHAHRNRLPTHGEEYAAMMPALG